MGILNMDINNVNLDSNFDEDDPDTIILIRILAWHIKLKKRKALKKSKWIIDANSVASYKMVEFLHVRRRKERNRSDFYWAMLLMYTIWEYWNILTHEHLI